MREDLRDRVKEKYAELATAAGGGDGGSCCGSSCGCGGEVAVGVSDLSSGSYSESERGELPVLAAEASLGCGNPVALADLYPELVCPSDQKLGKRVAANLKTSPGTTLVFTICLETPGATPFDPNAEVAGTDDWSEPFGNAQLRHHWLTLAKDHA